MVFIAFIALLMYGGRLPKVAMAVGRAVGELKRGLRETSDLVRYEIDNTELAEPHKRRSLPEQRELPTPDAARATEDLTVADDRQERTG
jgi:Sec-independent protein translocase protein TatA